MADRLKKTVREIKRGTSSSDFVLWKVYLENEVNFFHRQDRYLAVIISLLYNHWKRETDKPMTIEDAILRFEKPKPEEPEEQEWTDDGDEGVSVEVIADRSRSFWFAFCGLDPEGTPIPEKVSKDAKKPTPPPKPKLVEPPKGSVNV